MCYPYIRLETFVVLSVLLSVCLPAAHSAIESREVLQTYFETGDIPTQDQFSDLIDSFINLQADYGTSADTHTVTSLTGGIAVDAAGHAQLLTEGQTFDPAAATFLGTAGVGDGTAWPGDSGFLAFTFELSDAGETTMELEIVGVVNDAKVTSLLGEQEAALYLCYPQHYYTPGNALLIAPNIDPAAAVPLLGQELRDVSPRLALVNALPYSRVVSGFTYPQRMNAELFSVLALCGLILASVGIFGVLSLAVSERTREIGVRLALGASDRSIAMSVAVRAIVAVGLGAGIGLAVSMTCSRLASGLVFGVEPSDPVSLAVAPFILLSAAVLATWIPTRRALRVDAAISLREE